MVNGVLDSLGKVDRLLQSGGIDENQCPVDKRKYNGPKENPKSDHVDAFFNYFYYNFAL